MREIKSIPRLRFPDSDGELKGMTLLQLSDGGFSNGVFNDPKKVGQGYRIINVKDMYINSTIDVSSLMRIDIEDKDFQRNKVKYGDVFFTRSSLVKEGIAVSNINLSEDEDLTFDGHLIKMSPKLDLCNPIFLYNYFKTAISRHQFIIRGKTATMTTIGQNDISEITVVLPTISEQNKIADFLTAVDKRIQLLEKNKNLLETYKKGVMKKIFNQEIRFKDDKRNDFPDWMRKKIEEITLRISTGLNPRKNFSLGNGDNYYVTIKNISNGKIDFSTCEKIDDEALVKIKNRSDLSRDDIIMSSIGNIGESYLLTSDPTNWNINESVFVLRPNQELINPVFFYYILTNDNANKYFLGNMTGSSFKSIKIGDLREMPVSIPSLIEQKKISKFLKSIDNQIELVENQIDKSKTWKKGLLQKMFV